MRISDWSSDVCSSDLLGAVFSRFVEIEPARLLVGQRQLEAISKSQQIGVFELFVRVGGHAALAGCAHSIALLGVGQDHGGLAAMSGRSSVGGVYFHQVVAPAFQGIYL